MPETLLVELLCEELPPKALQRLSEAFAGGIEAGLRERGLLTASSQTAAYATPRRLAVSISAVASVAADGEHIEKLMPAKVALDAAGNFSLPMLKKLEGLARGHMKSLDARSGTDFFAVASDGKADYVYLHGLAKGQSLPVALQGALDQTLERLPVPKMMSYQRPDGTTVRFARPAHRLIVLHGKEVLEVTALGLQAGRVTAGHRFLGRREMTVETAQAWKPQLEAEGKVIASFAERREKIVDELKMAAAGATVIMPDALVDEVTALTEWPKVYTAGFDQAFLTVPQECLILTMQQNQRYFALADANGKLQNRFLLVSNIDPHDAEAIIRGNERVLRARLADAKFFFDQDRKTPLAVRVDKLRSIVYHNKLGTQAERIDRLGFLATRIAGMIGADAKDAARAALLAKADLVTDMVAEFPELQGVMGRYYALHDGEAPAVADAISQHYWPRHAGDGLPGDGPAQALALADKLESLAGMFGVGQLPTGDKDPFGLRRAALGVVRILIERKRRLSLSKLIALGFDAFDAQPAVKPQHEQLLDFIYERLRSYLRERGYTANQIASVLDSRPDIIDDLPDRLEAVRAFESLPEAQSLSAANKRIANILRKSEMDLAASNAVNPSFFVDGAESDLHANIRPAGPEGAALRRARRFRDRAQGPCFDQACDRPFFRRRHGHGRRSEGQGQPPGTAAQRGDDDEPRRRHIQARAVTSPAHAMKISACGRWLPRRIAA